MILLVGSSGRLGLQIARALRAHGRSVRALVRVSTDPARRAELESVGCQTIVGDLRTPSSLAAACSGVSTVISTATALGSADPSDTIQAVDEAGHLALIAAAEAASVQHFVFLSFPELDLNFSLQRAKRSIEARLANARLSFTVFKATFFAEVWWSERLGFSPARREARIFGPGTRPVSWVSLFDVVSFVVAATCEPDRFANLSVYLGGVAQSPLAVLELFESRKAVQFSPRWVPEADLEGRLHDLADDGCAEARVAMGLTIARGLQVDSAAALQLHRIELKTMADLAAQDENFIN